MNNGQALVPVEQKTVEFYGYELQGNNHFQAIYAELHRRFRVSSYKTIRQEQYQAVVDFLDRWANAAAKG